MCFRLNKKKNFSIFFFFPPPTLIFLKKICKPSVKKNKALSSIKLRGFALFSDAAVFKQITVTFDGAVFGCEHMDMDSESLNVDQSKKNI